jgi:hypothetical protein
MRRAPAMVGAAALLLGVFLTPQLASAQEPSNPELTVAPDVGLEHDQSVTVTLTGLPPYAEVLLSQCRDTSEPWSDPFCYMHQFPDGPWLYADGDGALEIEVPALRVLTTLFAEGNNPTIVVSPDRGLEDGDEVIVDAYGGAFHPDNFIDCAPTGCALVANYGGGNWASAPLAFNPALDAPEYHVAVWQAMLEGPGPDLTPAIYFATPIDGVDPVIIAPADITPDGNFSTTLTVQRLVSTPYDAYGNLVSTDWDCAAPAHDPDAQTSSIICGVLVTVSEAAPSPTGPWNAFWTHDLGFTPRGATVTIDPVLWLRNGTTTLQARGTVTCEVPMQVHVEGMVTQTITGKKKTTTVTGSLRADVWCSGTTGWEETVWPLSGQFKKGPAAVHLEASSLDHLTSSLDALVEIRTVRTK